MSTCTRLDLQTLGSHPIMSQNCLDHWYLDFWSISNWAAMSGQTSAWEFLGIVGQEPSDFKIQLQ